MTTPEVAAKRDAGYHPARVLEQNPELDAVLHAIQGGLFSPDEPERYQAIYDALVTWGDHYMLLADYAAYIEAQEKVDAAYLDKNGWSIKALRNVAAMGPFSSDRTIAEYAAKIWHTPGLAI
jgi:starch phosphorylase